MTERSLTGRCLCGSVQFELKPPVRNVIVCHCRQCAQWTGYAVAACAVALENFKITAGHDALKWHDSSDHAQRGFCGTCGSSLFWRPADGSRISVLAGSLDPPTGLHLSAHIFVGSKADYYEIRDNAPQFDRGAGERADVPNE